MCATVATQPAMYLILMAGFSNLNRHTLITRALRITDTDSNLRVIEETAQSRLHLYPQFRFLDFIDEDELHPIQIYIGTAFRRTECSPNDLTIGAWRLMTRSESRTPSSAYVRVSNFDLEPCSSGLPNNVACCTFSLPDDVEGGDILGILHGDSSSLLHEMRAAPQLEVLQGEEKETFFAPSTAQELGFPLLSFQPSKNGTTVSLDTSKA